MSAGDLPVMEFGRPVGVIETTAVRVMRLAEVDLDQALGEGEGYTSVPRYLGRGVAGRT